MVRCGGYHALLRTRLRHRCRRVRLRRADRGQHCYQRESVDRLQAVTTFIADDAGSIGAALKKLEAEKAAERAKPSPIDSSYLQTLPEFTQAGAFHAPDDYIG